MPNKKTTSRDSTSPPSSEVAVPSHSLPFITAFTEHEAKLIEFTLHPDQIASLMYGKTFKGVMRSDLVTRIFFATEHLKDAFLAFASAFSSNKNIDLGEPGGIPHEKRGSRALKVLANLEVSSVEEARTALVLALTIITYNDLHVGAPALPISRSALLLAAPLRHKLIGRTTEDTDPAIICLLFSELFECIVLGQFPVFRYEAPRGNTIVDRYYGICHELLPCLHDICLLYIAIKRGLCLAEGIKERLRDLTAFIDRWVPEQIIGQRQGVIKDEDEKRHFLCQARCFKSTIQLLILQCQRSPITDMLASSKALQLELEVFNAAARGRGRPNYLLFPYFVSSMELHRLEVETPEAILETMQKISNGIAPKSCKSMLAG